MIGTVILLGAIFCINAAIVPLPEPHVETRIVGGQPVTDRIDFRYQASIRFKNAHHCGGTIINGAHVLTSAYCCYDDKSKIHPTNDITVVVGGLKLDEVSNDILKKDVKHIFTHDHYSSKTNENDIAVIRIHGTFEPWTPPVGPLSLASNLPAPWTICKVSGWGKTSASNSITSNELQTAKFPVTDHVTCTALRPKNSIKIGMFCAGYSQGLTDTCEGDAGGPLVCNGVLTGIVSWGFDCGKADKPGVFTDVSLFKTWIDRQVARSSSGTSVVSIISVIAALVLQLALLQ